MGRAASGQGRQRAALLVLGAASSACLLDFALRKTFFKHDGCYNCWWCRRLRLHACRLLRAGARPPALPQQASGMGAHDEGPRRRRARQPISMTRGAAPAPANELSAAWRRFSACWLTCCCCVCVALVGGGFFFCRSPSFWLLQRRARAAPALLAWLLC